LIKNVLLLDAEGKRVAVKYFSDDWPNLSAKLAFEKSVFSKTQRTNARAEGKNVFPFPFPLNQILINSVVRR
jgi:hypothetical protein